MIDERSKQCKTVEKNTRKPKGTRMVKTRQD